jgi:trehalose-6-phosphate synthase
MAKNEELVLTVDQQRYIDWLCTAPAERVPATKQEFAATIGVDPSTMRRWEKKETFRSQWESQSKEHQGSPERTQGVLDTLYAKAVDGDVRAAQLWLQAMNKMAPAQVEVKHDRQASQLSDEELDELIGLMASREQSDRRHLKAM